jgi:signal transduction histidine kinase
VFLHRFLAEVERHLSHELAGKDVQLVIDAAYRGAAWFDEQKMLRVVHNIARNAVQAMAGGGTFRVATRLDGERLALEFSDTGAGIPPEMEGRLFELFATSGKKDGSGLGLAIVKKIVDEHHGTIGYESRRGEGSGTTFTVRLPLDKPAVVSDREEAELPDVAADAG